MHKTYLLPVKPRTSTVVKTVMWNLVPSFCGILSGIPMMVAFEWSDKTALSSTGSLDQVLGQSVGNPTNSTNNVLIFISIIKDGLKMVV